MRARTRAIDKDKGAGRHLLLGSLFELLRGRGGDLVLLLVSLGRGGSRQICSAFLVYYS